MRHQIRGRKLKRTSSHRKALLKNLASSLILHKRIRTTTAKAKELRTFIEPLITKARKNDLHSRRLIIDTLKNQEAVNELFSEVIGTIGDRPCAYTRVIKLGRRAGDSAELSMIEFVDYNEVANKKAEENKEKREIKQQAKKEKLEKEQKEIEDANVISETR
jgi:large subunit ribosomal protein L17